MAEENKYTNYPYLNEGEEKEIKTADQIISEISEVLGQWDGKDLEQIANQILSEKVKYIGDSNFEIQ